MSQAYTVTIEGTRPLLMHRIPFDLGQSQNNRAQSHDPQEEAEAALYRDANGNIVIPSLNLLAALKAAAVDYKVPGKGKKTFKKYIYAGIGIEPFMIPLKIPRDRDPEKAWEVDLRPVVVHKARIVRARPRFDQWKLTFTLTILDPIIKPDAIREILESAGKYQGLGDFRPLFGLFRVAEFVEAETISQLVGQGVAK